MRVHPVWKRKIVHQAAYCEEHGRIFLANYNAVRPADERATQRWGDNVAFDVELLLTDYRLEIPCQLVLREVGGNQRFDCTIGVFESAAIQRELERSFAPRPLTHRAMVSLMKALGGRLECVQVDKLLLAQRIYEAKLHVRHATGAVVVDVRISDAVVLAIICEVPIFVSMEVLEKLGERQQLDGTP